MEVTQYQLAIPPRKAFNKVNGLKKQLTIAILSVLITGMLLCCAGLLAYARLIGFGMGHDPLSTSTTLLHLMLDSHPYEKIPAYRERYLVKMNHTETLFKDLQLKKRDDLQMGAMIQFEHPQGMRCALYLRLNDGFVIYDFSDQSSCGTK